MGVNLIKGQKTDLTKGNPNLSKILVGLGWDVKRYDGGYDFDLDASAFLVGANGRVARDEDFIFYHNLRHYSGAVERDDEVIRVDLKRIPANIERVAFTVTIYEADERRQNFGQVSNAYFRILDEITGEELIHYDLGEDFSIETALVVGELYRHSGEWKFSAIGSGFKGGLRALCLNYGVNV